jgi:hypothetical protein
MMPVTTARSVRFFVNLNLGLGLSRGWSHGVYGLLVKCCAIMMSLFERSS